MPCIMAALAVRLVLVKYTTQNVQFPQCCGSLSLTSSVCSTYGESAQLLMAIFSRVCGEPLFFGSIELFIHHFPVAGALCNNWYAHKRAYTSDPTFSVSRLHISGWSSPILELGIVVSDYTTNWHRTYQALFFFDLWRVPTLCVSGMKGPCTRYNDTHCTTSRFLWNDYPEVRGLCKEEWEADFQTWQKFDATPDILRTGWNNIFSLVCLNC